jgi:hypothetical protein
MPVKSSIRDAIGEERVAQHTRAAGIGDGEGGVSGHHTWPRSRTCLDPIFGHHHLRSRCEVLRSGGKTGDVRLPVTFERGLDGVSDRFGVQVDVFDVIVADAEDFEV